MKLHTKEIVWEHNRDEYLRRVAVPGGWIYTEFLHTKLSSVFVPDQSVGEKQSPARDDRTNSITDELRKEIQRCDVCNNIGDVFTLCFIHNDTVSKQLNLI